MTIYIQQRLDDEDDDRENIVDDILLLFHFSFVSAKRSGQRDGRTDTADYRDAETQNFFLRTTID